MAPGVSRIVRPSIFSCILAVLFVIKLLTNSQLRAGARAVDLGGLSVYQGGQSLNLGTKAAVFKRESLLMRGLSMSIGGPSPLAPLGAGLVPTVPFSKDYPA